MLSIDTIAHVVVTAIRASASPSSFDTGLLMVEDANFADSKRLKTYTSSESALEGLTADGFGTTSEAYRCALKYFSASPSPTKLLVSCYPTTETPSEAVSAVIDITSGFYGVCFSETLTGSEILSLAASIMEQ